MKIRIQNLVFVQQVVLVLKGLLYFHYHVGPAIHLSAVGQYLCPRCQVLLI